MKKWMVIIILGVSQFVMILDSTVMNVSISNVAKDLGTTITGMQAAITFYALTMAALMLTGGKLGDIWGRRRAFQIGSIIYGLGSLITALAPSLGVLLLGWSVTEGLGAILVIPAIAALAAANYKGKDRVVAFSILGAATGLAAAVGPIIGGLVTTYLSWRYVFACETVIMVGVLLLSNKISDPGRVKGIKLDIPSVILSASGMALLVFGVLQSKTWGWVKPLATPQIGSQQIAPFGISIVAYLILAGVIVLKLFIDRQKMLEASGRDGLVKASLLKTPVLRSGLGALLSQYFVIAALFFVVPVYLQTILGLNALQTGLKLIPLSIGLVIFAALGSRLSVKYSAKKISRGGQICMAAGSLLILASIEPSLKSAIFWAGMFVIGAGFGLLASQLGNVNMSAVGKQDTAEVGGLQGTYQNLGSSFGTALVGSIFVLTLTTGFGQAISSNQQLSNDTKNRITSSTQTGVQIISPSQAEALVIDNGGDQASAKTVADVYQTTQVNALRQAMFFVFAMAIASLLLTANLPSTNHKKL